MNILIEQEVALHQYDIRQNKQEIARLIHPSFREIGQSGRSFDFQTIVEMMVNEQPSNGHIHSQDYEIIPLEPSTHLLLYRTVWIDELGNKTHYAKRSSIWSFNGENWQLKYHQGTPCEAFELMAESVE